MREAIAITGLGAVTGYGVGVGPAWEGMCAGVSTLRPIRRFDAAGFRCRVASEVPDFSARDHVPKSYRKAVKVMARDIELAVAAASEAARDAGLVTRGMLPEGATEGMTYPGSRIGCHIGAAMIAAEADELTSALVTSRDERGEFSLARWGTEEGGAGGMNNLTPLWLLKYLPNMLACHVTIIHGAEGPSNTITCNEASGLLSIGESMRVIERGGADLCFSGGAESLINYVRLLRVQFAGRLAESGEESEGWKLVRPYDADSPGSAPGECGAIAVLESAKAAAVRGARVRAVLAGFGAAHSPPPCIPPFAAPPKGAEAGLGQAIESALADAGVSAAEIDAVFPHASGSPGLDGPEAGALRSVFGDRLARVPIATLTPFVGECLAGNGGLMLAIAVRAVEEQKLPARLHAGSPAGGLDAGAAPARPAALRKVLVCTSSLGGQNAAIVVRRAG